MTARADHYRNFSAARGYVRRLRRLWSVMRKRGWDDARIAAAEPHSPYSAATLCLIPVRDPYAHGAAMNRCRFQLAVNRDSASRRAAHVAARDAYFASEEIYI